MKSYWNEEWKEIEIIEDPTKPVRQNYAISNYGRLVSYRDSIEDGKIMKYGYVLGYAVLSLCRKIKHSRCVHKLVAHYFLPEPKSDQTCVIHLDFDKLNNSVKNLQWATREKLKQHQNQNPKMLYARKNHTPRNKGPKLNIEKVKRLKKAIHDPNRKRTLKEIAKRYGISQMQLYRIKAGKDWAHVDI
jgi:hypothetical protein